MKKMDFEGVDHYAVLGLGCGKEGLSLSMQDITKGYRLKARELHPDKRPNDPNAHANFLNLQNSYRVLKDHAARKVFDDDLRRRIQIRRDEERIDLRRDSKRRKMVSDLDERERSAQAQAAGEDEEERISRQLKHEISRIIAMQHSKKSSNIPKVDVGGLGLNRVVLNSKIKFSRNYENQVLEKLRNAR